MKRVIAGIVAAGLLATVVLVVPQPAYAWDRHGHFVGGFAVGAVTGLVLGGLFAPSVYAAPPVVYQPAPVYVAPPPVVYQPAPVYAAPAPVCSNYWVNGYWYGPTWVPGHWQQACQ